MKTIGIGRAYGKVILIGEHSVVYGEPAISIPFLPAKTEVVVRESLGEVKIDCDFYKGTLKNSKEDLYGVRTIVEKIVYDLKKELINFNIQINTTIPVERGMGSSAAVAVAVTKGLYDFFDIKLPLEDLIKYTDISEKIIHGNSSGLDAATIIGEKSLYYIKGEKFMPFKFNLDSYLIVADSGEIGNTKKAVEGVRNLLNRDYINTKKIIKDLGKLSKDAKYFMENNKSVELGEVMLKSQKKLYSLNVSNEKLDSLVSRAMKEGAFGAKLTGGGQGGSMIALGKDKETAIKISKGLLDEGARETWISNLGDVYNE